MTRREEPGQKDIAGPNRGERLDVRRDAAESLDLALFVEEREAARFLGDEDVARAELGDRVECHGEVLLLVELLADEALGLALVRRDEKRLRAGSEPKRLAFGIEDGLHASSVQVADRLRVEVVLDGARKRAREDDRLGAVREVVQLVAEDLELLRLDVRPPFVDLRVRGGGRVDDGRRGARLVADADEVVEDRLGGQLLDDARARETAREPGGDDRHLEPLERPGDVDALAAGEGQAAAACPVPLAALEVGHGERAIESGVERDGDDHETQPHMFSAARPTNQPARWSAPGSEIEREATSGELAISRCRS